MRRGGFLGDSKRACYPLRRKPFIDTSANLSPMQLRSRFASLTASLLVLTACEAEQSNSGHADSSGMHGVVVSASPEAPAAGVEILERGGNAIDAALAVQFALGVTEPAMSGLGGQSQIIIHPPNGAPYVINGTSYAAGAIPEEIPARALVTGWTATTVPSTVKVMDFAQRNFGSGNVSWADTLAPAVRYAEEGFEVGQFRALVYQRHEDDLRSSPTAAALFLMPDGALPQLGDIVRQPVLANTLTRLARDGAEDFYTGSIAAEIAADMQRYGGWISADDLAATPDPRVQEPLTTTYRGYDVFTLPPPAGGWVVLQALNILEQFPADTLSQADAERAGALLHALQIAHRSRQDTPETDLVNYEKDIGLRISKETASALSHGAARAYRNAGGETTHFSVVDSDGLAVSVTASIDSYFGARVASPSLGFLYNNYMQSLENEPGHPFSVAPRAMPYSSMSATIIAKDGAPIVILGSPGSARIISAVTQVSSHWIDVNQGIERAVAAARVHVVPDDDGRDNAYLESTIPGLDLEALSFDLIEPQTDLSINGLNAYFGGVHAIGRENGAWRGAADPRRDGSTGYANPH